MTLPSEIVSSVDMYSDDTTVNEQTSKTYKDVNLASDLSSDLKKVVKWVRLGLWPSTLPKLNFSPSIITGKRLLFPL